MWTLLLIVLITDQPSRVLVSNHEPFETQQACNDFAASIEDKTVAVLTKLDGYRAHATVCVLQPARDS